ncbi:MAG: ribbon-helix-helix protein, CopG family, partial [Methanomicrobium sp.]|nr:ribbon-helix-helix protein, CopG family [Methanomicrobium sp.]
MVRFSVTMDDGLVEKIDKAAAPHGKSRSEWINEACSFGISGACAAGGGRCAEELLNLRERIPKDAPNMTDYESLYKNFKIDLPEYFNFGFDVIDAWAKIDRNKRAMIWVNQSG